MPANAWRWTSLRVVAVDVLLQVGVELVGLGAPRLEHGVEIGERPFVRCRRQADARPLRDSPARDVEHV